MRRKRRGNEEGNGAAVDNWKKHNDNEMIKYTGVNVEWLHVV